MPLKNIVYIDYEKIYSFSAQLFEGLIHSAIEKKEIEFEEVDAVILKEKEKSNTESDKKSLSVMLNPHDYNYIKFEKALYDTGRIFEIDDSEIDLQSLADKSFIKIKGKITLTDYESLKYTTKNFNSIGYAINYISKNDEILSLDEEMKDAQGPKIKNIKIAKEQILNQIKTSAMDNQKEFLKNLNYILDYAYGKEVEISQRLNNKIYTSLFIKDFFKIPIDMFIKRYSRKSTKEFIVVGLITQLPRDKDEETDNNENTNNMRKAILNMNDALHGIESSFCTPFDNEIFIEPIALYTEL